MYYKLEYGIRIFEVEIQVHIQFPVKKKKKTFNFEIRQEGGKIVSNTHLG
jgi:hypothetical protein